MGARGIPWQANRPNRSTLNGDDRPRLFGSSAKPAHNRLSILVPMLSAASHRALDPAASHDGIRIGAAQDAHGQGRVKCRQIEGNDIEAVVALLTRGFPERTPAYWHRGFVLQGRAHVPPGYPHYGYLIENNGRPVGAVLLLCSPGRPDDGQNVRCNISSWYVEPAFRCYASMLVAVTTPRKAGTTYVNISPAPYTWPIIEAQGFICHCRGQFFAIPALNQPVPRTALCHVTAQAAPKLRLPVSEQRLLFNHAEYGCVSVCLTESDGTAHPFVFLPFRLPIGFVRVPCMHLIYCRDISDFVRFSGNIGRFLLRFHALLVAVDANGPIRGLMGLHRGKSRMYFKGPQAPRLGDLAYTERVVFGP